MAGTVLLGGVAVHSDLNLIISIGNYIPIPRIARNLDFEKKRVT